MSQPVLRNMQSCAFCRALLAVSALWLLMLAGCSTPPPLPRVSAGTVERLGQVPSKFVEPRLVDVWLPDDYTPAKRYAVLYLQDGQALFDGATSMSKKGWHIDAAMDRLRREGRTRDTIVVGIWNTNYSRHAEYFPQKVVPLIEEPTRTQFVQKGLEGNPRADNYLRFMVEELKPMIDRRYPTRTDASNTFIMGSSMGGIISLYAISEYPQVFGAAACLSTHWIGAFESNTAIPLATFTYFRDHLPDPATHRIYMDRGTIELDALYPVHQSFANVMLREKGYTDASFQTLVFEGAGHNEADWAKRLDTPLTFLLGPAAGSTP
jgi:enterochelin esterase-like enzyme